MKKYVIVDQVRNGDCFTTVCDTEIEALTKANAEWRGMTDHDRNRREFYAVMCGEWDEWEGLDFNSAEIVKAKKM